MARPYLPTQAQATGRTTLPRIPFSDWYVAPSARTAAARALATGWVANGPEVCSFESEFARHVGARFAVAVSSGTTALELALEVLQLPRGSRVLVCTLSSFAVAQAIVRAGLRPVLVDVSVLTGMPSSDHHQRGSDSSGAGRRATDGAGARSPGR